MKEDFNLRDFGVENNLIEFIEKSPSAFHVVANFTDMLEDAGFEQLDEKQRWTIKPQGKYYVTRNASSLIAFCMPQEKDFAGFNIASAHSDSPSFKIKENPEMTTDNNYISLNVEKYGGMLMAPWFDRPLSIAGRVVVRDNGGLKQVLVNVDRDLCVIPIWQFI